MPLIANPSPVRTANLVLKTRIAVLMRNLEDMEGALGSVKERRADLRGILSLRDGLSKSVRTLTRNMAALESSVNDGAWDEIQSPIERVREEVKALERQLAESENAARRLSLPLAPEPPED